MFFLGGERVPNGTFLFSANFMAIPHVRIAAEVRREGMESEVTVMVRTEEAD